MAALCILGTSLAGRKDLNSRWPPARGKTHVSARWRNICDGTELQLFTHLETTKGKHWVMQRICLMIILVTVSSGENVCPADIYVRLTYLCVSRITTQRDGGTPHGYHADLAESVWKPGPCNNPADIQLLPLPAGMPVRSLVPPSYELSQSLIRAATHMVLDETEDDPDADERILYPASTTR